MKVVNLHKEYGINWKKFKSDPNCVYIGRYHPFFGKSKWYNPYKIGTNEELVEKYREYILSRSDLLEDLQELKGKEFLGCWCKPKVCHGDVLIELLLESKK